MMTKIQIFIFLMVFFCSALDAQLSYYNFNQSIKTYEEITNGTVIESGTNTLDGPWLNNINDPYSLFGNGFDIGFEFNFRNINYDKFGISREGYIFLGKSVLMDSAVTYVGAFASPDAYAYVTGEFNDTLRSTIAAMNSRIYGRDNSSNLTYKIIGASPFRTLVIQWKNYKLIGFGNPNNTNINFQIRLNEIDNSIDIHYGNMSFQNFNIYENSQVGLWGINIEDFSIRKLDGQNDWNTTIEGLEYQDGILIQNSLIPPYNGLNFKWTKPLMVPPTSVDVVEQNFTKLALDWQTPPNLPPFQYQYALTESQSPPTSGFTMTDTTYCKVENLNLGTLYYFHIRSYLNNIVHSTWYTIKVKTLCSPPNLPFYDGFDTYDIDEDVACYNILNTSKYTDKWKVSDYYIGLQPRSFTTDVSNPLDDDYLILPPFKVDANKNYFLSFDHNNAPFTIYRSHSIVKDSFDYFEEVTPLKLYNQYYKYFHSDIEDTLYFAIKSTQYNQIDNLEFGEYLCDPPYDFSHILSDSSATISWVSDFSDSVEIELVSLENVYPLENSFFTTQNTHTFNGLNPGTPYFFNIRGHCNTRSPWQTYEFALPPTNDACSLATELIPSLDMDCYSIYGSTYGATNNDTTSCIGLPDDDVWYKFTATSRTHSIQTSLGGGCGEYYPQDLPNCQPYIIEIFQSSCAGIFMECIVADSASIYSINRTLTGLNIDSTYYIRLFTEGIGRLNFNICITSYLPSANDSCVHAKLIETILPICDNIEYGNLAATTASNLNIGSCNGSPYYDLWYKFAVTDTVHIIDVNFDSGIDGVIQVMQGECGNLTEISCTNNDTIGSEIALIQNLIIGDTIRFRIFDADGLGSFSNTLTCVKKLNENDNCTGASEILQINGISFSELLIDNTFSATGNGSCNTFEADDDLWYKFIATDTFALINVIRFFPAPIIDPIIEYYGANCSISQGCSESGELFTNNLSIGNEYFFKIYSKALGSGKGRFAISVTTPPSNYTCQTPINLIPSINDECTNEVQATNISSGVENEVWFRFTAIDTFHMVEIFNSDYYKAYFSIYKNCDSLPVFENSSLSNFLEYGGFEIDSSYLIKVAGVYGDGSFRQFNFSICILSRVQNDEAINATLIQPGNFCENSVLGSTEAATSSINTGSCDPNSTDIWYKFQPSKTYHKLKITKIEIPGIITGNFPRVSIFKYPDLTNEVECINGGLTTIEGRLTNLDTNAVYYFRLLNAFPQERSRYDICISSPPINDYCQDYDTIQMNLVHRCISERTGTTINATLQEGEPVTNKPNVFYKIIGAPGKLKITVTPLTPGFDPKIRLFEKTTGSLQANLCLDYGVKSLKSDHTHIDFQPEVLAAPNLKSNKEYFIEVSESDSSSNSGNFRICVQAHGGAVDLNFVEYESYKIPVKGYFDLRENLDTIAAGSIYQPVGSIKLNVSGDSNPVKVTRVKLSLEGTTDLNDIYSISIYSGPTQPTFGEKYLYDPIEYNVGLLSSTFVKSIQFGSSISPNSNSLTFDGELDVLGGATSSGNFGGFGGDEVYKYLFVVVNMKCTSVVGQVLKVKCTEIVANNTSFTPYELVNIPIKIVPQIDYNTINDGSWDENNTWLCGAPPPQNVDMLPIHIWNDVYIEDTIQCADLYLSKYRSLYLQPHSVLTLGDHSNGNNAGNSNKGLYAYEGKLILDNATLNVNGALYSGNFNPTQYFDGIQKDTTFKLFLNNEIFDFGTDKQMIDVKKFCIENGVLQLENETPNALNNKSQNDPIALFSLSASRSIPDFSDKIKEYTLLDYNRQNLDKILKQKLDKFSIILPSSKRTQKTITLKRIHVLKDNVSIRSKSKGLINDYIIPLTYVSVENEETKMVITFTNEDIVGMAMIDGKSYSLSKVKNTEQYSLIADDQIHQEGEMDCQYISPYDKSLLSVKKEVSSLRSVDNLEKCVKLYVEVDYNIYQDKGNVQNVINFAANLYSQVFFIYALEGVKFEISEINIWDELSPYIGPSKEQMLATFNQGKNEFNGDVAQLISYTSSGGFAYIDVLCHPDKKLHTSFASIYSSYVNFPNYSWSVLVCAHELGHNLGSRHTHDCAWNGNNTAIDNCSPTVGCNATGNPINGGTIMSYCHLTNYGINFNNGFGSQPGNLIRSKLSNASCIESCGDNLCTATELKVKLQLDHKPKETFWSIRNDRGKVIYSSLQYNLPNANITKSLCIEDGCYLFSLYDDYDRNPWELIGINSTINIDGNDGTMAGSNTDGFQLYTPKFYSNNLNINLKDPSYFTVNHRGTQNHLLHGKITFGGGDDTIPNVERTGYLVRFGGLISDIGGNTSSFLIPDTVLISEGLNADNRAVKNLKNGQILIKNFIINPGAEYIGGVNIIGNMVNNGLYTDMNHTRELVFCKDVVFINYFDNDIYSQSLSGTGFFRSGLDQAIPTNQNDNYVTNLHVANSFSGLDLNMPLGVRKNLRLRYDINNGDNLFTIGDSINFTNIVTMPSEDYSKYGLDFVFDTIQSFTAYDGGVINGKVKRWFKNKVSKVVDGIIPIGKNGILHPLLYNFNDSISGSVTAEYFNSASHYNGMPIGVEQNTFISNLSPTGFWQTSSNNINSSYNLTANASGFTLDGIQPINNLNNIRLIKTDASDLWAPSLSTTTQGPSNLNFIKLDSISGFDKIGVGTDYCKYVIKEWDYGIGSLRYTIDSCSSSGDTIYFLAALDTISLNTDTLIINKNLTLDFNHQHTIVIDGHSTNLVFKIEPDVSVFFKNINIIAGQSITGSGIINDGSLTLEKVGIFKTVGSNELINNSNLVIKGPNFIKIQ